ncbi:hypothetical protein AJ80_02910 [Polytolypa hystricis UAMH7299]|uniref:Carbohydrate kinase PfkB domain-containing protein n=1 Tax=Polytolypa hystricis (strain UAMH7299) TaxID=1447883 RepID=A0A2B7YNW7_POLH7|nr:hypothetical protein AJ80_02910 [Polytolypa hystricis UAMH7299]
MWRSAGGTYIYDFPQSIDKKPGHWNTSKIVRESTAKQSTRGLLEYEDTTFGPKKFQYTTPILSISNNWLTCPAEQLASRSFHFLESPSELEHRISTILKMRDEAGIKERPLIIWEPSPLSCKSENLAACLKAVRLVDVFSPNHLELLTLCGESPDLASDKAKLEVLALKFLEEGRVGPEGAGTVVIRATEHGCMIRSCDMSPTWMPPYYQPEPGAQAQPKTSKVVDPTGAGNAFLGAYAIGLLKPDGNHVQAACYGSVAASFALEQVGIPKLIRDGGKEVWNGVSVISRLHEYASRLGIATEGSSALEDPVPSG